MGAEQSTAGAEEEPTATEEAAGQPKPAPSAMSLDQNSTEAVLAGMEGVMARVPAEAITSGATLKELTLHNLPTNTKRSGGSGSSSKSSPAASMRRSFFSWRPTGGSSARSDAGSQGRLTDRFFSSKRGKQHNDPKLVFAGLNGASLHCALNHPRRLKEVLQTGGTNPNAKDEDGDRTPLHWAAARGHLRCIHLLLEAGADPSVVDANGQTPAQVAEAVEQPLAHDLLVHGPPKPDPCSMHSGLFSLSLHSALNQPTELRKILESGYEWRIQKGEPIKCKLDPNLADSDGDRTPLHWAAARGYIECVKLLLQYGASPGSTDCNGKTPAALAFECNQRATQSLLLNYKPPSVREGMHSINDPVAIDQLDLVA